MTSSIRNQTFDPVEPVSDTLNEPIDEIIEGKDDYFTTDDDYPNFDYTFLNGR